MSEEKKTRKPKTTHFPMLCEIANQQVIIKSMMDLPIGVDIKILEYNYKPTWAK